MRCFRGILLLSVMIFPVPTFAFGFSGGGSSTWSLPDEYIPDAQVFEDQIYNADPRKVRQLMFLERLCSDEGFSCGKMTEEQAAKLADYRFTSAAASWDFWVKIALGVVSVYGAGLATFSYRKK